MEINNELPKVAVLMATYNGERYLREQIDSILAQQHVSVGLFVRDDRSVDATVTIIKEYADKTGRVFLLPSRETQLRVTKNFYSIVKETELSAFDYMCYSDQDDIWQTDKLHQAIKAIEVNNAQCYASNLTRVDASGALLKERSLLKRLIGYLFNSKSGKQTAYDHYFEAASAGCTLVLKKNAAVYFQQRVGEIYETIPEDTSHDWSTYAITRLGGFTWFIDERSFIFYRQHAENAYGANAGLGGLSKLLEWFTSGRYRMHILMIDSLYNTTGIHPSFMKSVTGYRQESLVSRFRMASAVSRYRRKKMHRLALFILIIAGFCK